MSSLQEMLIWSWLSCHLTCGEGGGHWEGFGGSDNPRGDHAALSAGTPTHPPPPTSLVFNPITQPLPLIGATVVLRSILGAKLSPRSLADAGPDSFPTVWRSRVCNFFNQTVCVHPACRVRAHTRSSTVARLKIGAFTYLLISAARSAQSTLRPPPPSRPPPRHPHHHHHGHI